MARQAHVTSPHTCNGELLASAVADFLDAKPTFDAVAAVTAALDPARRH